jgi:hypothetical protein
MPITPLFSFPLSWRTTGSTQGVPNQFLPSSVVSPRGSPPSPLGSKKLQMYLKASEQADLFASRGSVPMDED